MGLQAQFQQWARPPAGKSAASRPSGSADYWLAPAAGPRVAVHKLHSFNCNNDDRIEHIHSNRRKYCDIS